MSCIPAQLHSRIIAIASATLAVTTMIASFVASQSPSSRADAAIKKMSPIKVVKPTQITQCTGCHGDDLAGRPGFSPSLRATGIIKTYTLAQFEKVMDTGITPKGTSVIKPMPVYGFKAPIGKSIYIYLKSQK